MVSFRDFKNSYNFSNVFFGFHKKSGLCFHYANLPKTAEIFNIIDKKQN